MIIDRKLSEVNMYAKSTLSFLLVVQTEIVHLVMNWTDIKGYDDKNSIFIVLSFKYILEKKCHL